MKYRTALLFTLLLVSLGLHASAQSNITGSNTTGVRNVVLLIGDGMGDSEITIARNYHYGAAGRLAGRPGQQPR